MSITDAYVTVPEYKAWINRLSSNADIMIARQLEAASRWWDRRVGQFFGRDDAAVERLFEARYSDRLDLDYEGDCPGIATQSGLIIKVDTDGDGSFADESAWSTSDYQCLPLQADKGPEPRPWDRIVRSRGGSRSFVPGNLVSVTAIFGWPAVPLAIKEGVLEWCAIWRGESIRTTARVNEMDQVETVSPYHLGQLNKIMAVYGPKVTF